MQGGINMCIGKEGEYENVKRHIQDVPAWLCSKKRLITTALNLVRPGVTPHVASLVQGEETCEQNVQARSARKQATRA